MSKKILPYGSWKSPITSELVASDSVALDAVRIHAGAIFWLERRPAESGRTVIVSFSNDSKTDLFPQPYNARSRVHEYGGGVYCICEQGVFFVNDADQDIYRARGDAAPERITATGRNMRYADLCFDDRRQRIICVCEDHTGIHAEAANSLVAVDIASGAVETLQRGYDFYSSPRLDHDGRQLAWLCWNHPNMPWDGTELWVADIDAEGQPGNPTHVSGDDTTSIFQPEWSPDNTLYFVTDRSGWWNLARLEPGGTSLLTRLESEFGLPQWVFGQTTYAFWGKGSVYCTHITDGRGRLSHLDTATLELTELAVPYNAFSSICAEQKTLCCIAASETEFPQVIMIDVESAKPGVIARSCRTDIDDGFVSRGQGISFRTRHADEAYAIYYPPANRDYDAPQAERPPLIVLSHGGPTAAADASLDLRKQYWTSRGFAILDVNYSGSTGYGRSYRDRLKNSWGLRDVEDVCDATEYLAGRDIVDRNRLIIKGSSAGGYTVLCALTFHDVFACGASYYGISDLESLLADTHKFESHYTEQLVGPYPERKRDYFERSPINFVDRLCCPVIFFQGLEDRVVPPSQAEAMVAALRQKGIAVSYVQFPEEQHGFRRADTIRIALDSELYFYSVVLDFTPADSIAAVPIYNTNAQ